MYVLYVYACIVCIVCICTYTYIYIQYIYIQYIQYIQYMHTCIYVLIYMHIRTYMHIEGRREQGEQTQEDYSAFPCTSPGGSQVFQFRQRPCLSAHHGQTTGCKETTFWQQSDQEQSIGDAITEQGGQQQAMI